MKHLFYHIVIFLIFNTFLYLSCFPQYSVDFAYYLEIPVIEDAMLSPDGNWVFYSIKTPLWESNSWKKEVFTISVKELKTNRLANLDKGRAFQFSPNGKYIAYLRDEGVGTQLWVQAFPHGKAFLLNYSPSPIKTYEWGKESLNIYFVNHKPDSIPPNPYAFYADEGSNGRLADNWEQIWEIKLMNKQLRPLTIEPLIIEELDPAPDGNFLAFTASSNRNIDQPYLKEIFLLNLKNLEVCAITSNKVPESAPLWSQDGKRLAFRSTDRHSFLLSNKGFHIYDLSRDSTYSLKGQHIGKVDHIAWSSDGEYLFFNETRGFFTHPYKIDIYQDTISAFFPEIDRGTFRALSYDSNRTKMLYRYGEIQKLGELYLVDLSTNLHLQITHIYQSYQKQFLQTDSSLPFKYESDDQTLVEGLYLSPFNRRGQDTEKIPPLIVMLHGGPAENWTDKFEPSWQFWRANGYAIFAPNVRGSSGYGDILLNLLKGDIGGGEYEDIMAGVNALILEGKACEDNLFIMGWSWGGVLGSWSIAKTKRFKAAVLGAPAVDWLAETGSGFTYDLKQWYIGKSSVEAPQLWQEYSSIHQVRKIQTPTLIAHGALDRTHHLHQSRILFHNLQENGVPARLLIFPQQGHRLDCPQEIYSYHQAAIEWIKGVR